MYFLLGFIHIVFIYGSYQIGSLFLSIVFLCLFVFLSFYFSPLFLSQTVTHKSKGFFSEITENLSWLRPTSSLLPSVSLFYIALYGMMYSVFGTIDATISYHIIISAGIYLLLASYYLITQSWNDIFYHSLRYHTIFIIFVSIVYFFLHQILGFSVNPYMTVLLGFALGVSVRLLYKGSEHDKYDVVVFTLLVSGIISFLFLILGFLQMDGFFLEVALLLCLSILFFYFPLSPSLLQYQNILRYFGIIGIYLSLFLSYFLLAESISDGTILILPIIVVFILIHRSYENYISYFSALINIYILYSMIFMSLFLVGSFSSSLLFIFFLPAALILATYFWEQTHGYDFVILHYLSIFSSVVFSLYYLFFVSLASDLLFQGSVCIFGIAVLSFLSFLRFRTTQPKL